MAKALSDLKVDGIALVTKEHRPAVEKAEKKYAIFKTLWGLFKTDKSKTRLTKLALNLKKLEEWDYLDTMLNTDDPKGKFINDKQFERLTKVAESITQKADVIENLQMQS